MPDITLPWLPSPQALTMIIALFARVPHSIIQLCSANISGLNLFRILFMTILNISAMRLIKGIILRSAQYIDFYLCVRAMKTDFNSQ